MVCLKSMVRWLVRATALVATSLAGLLGCDLQLPKHIVEYPGRWQTVAPGQPTATPPKVEVLTVGNGPTVEPGDLVQLRIVFEAADKTLHKHGTWWNWVGFRTAKETPHFGNAPYIASGLMGLKQGSTIVFLEVPPGISSGSHDVGQVRLNPFGNIEQWGARKYDYASGTILIPYQSGRSKVEIMRVCKAQLQYRTVRLYDDGPVRVGQGYDTWISNEPRELWVDQALLIGKCDNGQLASFEYGPVQTPGTTPRFVVTGYFDQWIMNAWKKLPKGVELK